MQNFRRLNEPCNSESEQLTAFHSYLYSNQHGVRSHAGLAALRGFRRVVKWCWDLIRHPPVGWGPFSCKTSYAVDREQRAEPVPHDWRPSGSTCCTCCCRPSGDNWWGMGRPRDSRPAFLSVVSPVAVTPADGWRNRLAATKTRCPFPSCVSGWSPSPSSAGRERGARLFVFLSSCNRPTFKVASGYLPRWTGTAWGPTSRTILCTKVSRVYWNCDCVRADKISLGRV